MRLSRAATGHTHRRTGEGERGREREREKKRAREREGKGFRFVDTFRESSLGLYFTYVLLRGKKRG